MPRVASRKKDDVLSSSVEANWFNAWEHMDEMRKYCADWRGHRWLQVLDVFSYGKGMQAVVGTMPCASYDIRLDRKRHDITSRRGVFLLLGLGMCLAYGGLITCAPPCSLSIFLRCSVHLRHLLGPLGDTTRFKVRLSNRIVLNMVGVSPKQFLDLIYVYTYNYIRCVRVCAISIYNPSISRFCLCPNEFLNKCKVLIWARHKLCSRAWPFCHPDSVSLAGGCAELPADVPHLLPLG